MSTVWRSVDTIEGSHETFVLQQKWRHSGEVERPLDEHRIVSVHDLSGTYQ